MTDFAGAADAVSMGAGATIGFDDGMRAPRATFDIVCHDPAGNEKWRETVHNLVTTPGKTDILDKYLKGSGYTASWFLGLAGTGSKAVGDTLASHAGWTEITAYAGNRPAITWGTTSAGSNTGTAVVITMNGSYTVAGAFTSSVASGTSGILYNVADFAVARSGGSGDTLTITPTLTIT
jgi:hypothetical protein